MLDENRQLRLDLAREKVKRETDQKDFLLNIISRLDTLEQEEEDNSEASQMTIVSDQRKKVLVDILDQYGVKEIESYLYQLPGYSNYNEKKDGGNTPLLKGYLFKGSVLRKAKF